MIYMVPRASDRIVTIEFAKDLKDRNWVARQVRSRDISRFDPGLGTPRTSI